MVILTDRTQCRHCSAPIVLARVWFMDDPARAAARPTWQPIDVDPASLSIDNEAGNQAVHRTATGDVRARALRDGEDPLPNEVRAMPHWATCRARAARGADPGNVMPMRRRSR